MESTTNLVFTGADFGKLIKHVNEFREELDNNYDIILTTPFGAKEMTISEVKYDKPVLLILKGTVEGIPCILVQHTHEVNLMIRAVRKSSLSVETTFATVD